MPSGPTKLLTWIAVTRLPERAAA